MRTLLCLTLILLLTGCVPVGIRGSSLYTSVPAIATTA